MLLGSLRVEARILGLSELATVVAGALLMALAGAAYGRLFGRAANDARGGWLFGMAFGFALWAGGAVMVLPLASGGQGPARRCARCVFLSLGVAGAAPAEVSPVSHH